MSLTELVHDPVAAANAMAAGAPKTAALAAITAAVALSDNGSDKKATSVTNAATAVTNADLAETSHVTAKAKEDLAAVQASLAHAAQIARNLTAATAAKNAAKLQSDAADAAADVSEEKAALALTAFRTAAEAAGVSYVDDKGERQTPSSQSYLASDGRLVPSLSSVDASGIAAAKYLLAAQALDLYNMLLSDYNNALAVPDSDANKKSQAQLDAMLVVVNDKAVLYNAAALAAKASAQNAESAASSAAASLVSSDAASVSAVAARASANAAEQYYNQAVNDVTNSAVKAISLNLNVEIDAENNINVFGEKSIQPENVVIASYKLPVDALYDNAANKGLIEFWEPVDAQGDIRVELAHSVTVGGVSSYKDSAVKLVNGMEKILCDEIDCSGCKPFNDSKYMDASGAIVKYTKQRDFGRVALGTLAHYMFGHVDATSAITNDVAFVKSMLSLNAGTDDQNDLAAMNETSGGRAARYAVYAPVVAADVNDLIDATGSASDANLAKRLIGAVLRKGMSKDASNAAVFKSSNVIANKDDINCLANIVRQVIGQDQTRSMNQDNSERALDQHILLRFYPGDIVYMNIKLKKPTVSISPGPNASTGLTVASLADSYASEISFTLKVTLA